MKRCAVLFVNPDRQQSTHPAYLRDTGFVVRESRGWPADDRTVRQYHVVIVCLRAVDQAPMIAARIRAKPLFGRRLLVGVVPPDALLQDRRSAQAGGFDLIVNDGCESRSLAARILRALRSRPELRCTLPPFAGRSAA